MQSPVLGLLGGGGEVDEDEVGELEDVVAFFEAEGEVGLLAGGEEQAALVFFQAAGGRDAGEIRLGEGEADAVFFLSQLRHAQGGGTGAEQGDGDEVRDALGRLAVAVDEFVDDVVALFLGADAGHAAVEVHALLRGGDVFLRDGGGDGEVRRAPGRLFHGLALLLQDGLL